ncbi:hypothetical protein L1887_34747 [Cichorium endivia]|nr:hypothetical protein L1887_34747 [Cichorium endivia]
MAVHQWQCKERESEFSLGSFWPIPGFHVPTGVLRTISHRHIPLSPSSFIHVSDSSSSSLSHIQRDFNGQLEEEDDEDKLKG